jgi:TrmH family RNA methyltransferase
MIHKWSIALEKYVRSLHQAKFRKKYNNFIAEGDKICKEFVINKSLNIEHLIATSAWLGENKTLLSDIPYKIVEATEKNMSKISGFRNPSDVLMVLQKLNYSLDVEEIAKCNAIYLDDVQDPGNVGNIIRIAAWFGFSAVIRSAGSADFYNPKVVQSSMGTLTKIGLHTMDAEDLRKIGVSIYGADMSGKNIFDVESVPAGILVIGNEGKGLQASIKAILSKTFKIPSFGSVESLNAAVACGILCAEIKARQ